jgi:hypothetical protein
VQQNDYHLVSFGIFSHVHFRAPYYSGHRILPNIF